MNKKRACHYGVALIVGCIFIGGILHFWPGTESGTSDKPACIVRLSLVDAPTDWNGKESVMVTDEETKVEVPSAETQRMFKSTIQHRGWFLWKGGCLGIAEMDDGSTRQITVSYYDGVFRFRGDSVYYEVVGDSREVFDATLKSAVEDQFIPRRMDKLQKGAGNGGK